MNKKKVFINIILVYLIFFINSAYSFKNRIIANVGSEIISSYELKNKMSRCIEKNEGNIENCIEFRTDFENCLNIIGKRVVKTQEKTIHTDLVSLYN